MCFCFFVTLVCDRIKFVIVKYRTVSHEKKKMKSNNNNFTRYESHIGEHLSSSTPLSLRFTPKIPTRVLRSEIDSRRNRPYDSSSHPIGFALMAS